MIINTLCILFFGTSISISINGDMGKSFLQDRGLRQGDPLSSLLFNLAFEPLLRSILACPALPGVTLQPVSVVPSALAYPSPYRHPDTGVYDHPIDETPPMFKLLTYADDLEVFLSSSPSEWPTLQLLLHIYGLASNAKVNLHKTEVVSLSGNSSPDWAAITAETNISYHTKSSQTAVRYLGYRAYNLKC